MDPYQRTSSVVPSASLPAALRDALARVADVPDDHPVLLTTATRTAKPGFFGKLFGGGAPAQLLTAVAHLPDSVALATLGDPKGTPAWRLPFASLGIEPPLRVAGVELPPGLTLVSPLLGMHEGSPGTYGVFVGPEPEAAAFLARLRDAARG
ncbi:MAG: hypothetical protein H6721_27355 [Sandaracinus sp.]|nr:hypothetical protein [Sandaracinus sp.]MCB9616503.1 hypothetical protein [Sandaracinus sp.]MCB9635852.1 hypothetical protein [Sandaracinus sp.]